MADVWSWVIGYAILFAVVQLVIYAYYVRRGESRASATGIADPDDYQHVGERIERDPLVENDVDDPNDLDAVDDDIRGRDDEVSACPHCGTPNMVASTIRYCRNCTRSLG